MCQKKETKTPLKLLTKIKKKVMKIQVIYENEKKDVNRIEEFYSIEVRLEEALRDESLLYEMSVVAVSLKIKTKEEWTIKSINLA